MNIGIVGGGQLARMLILAGYPLGLRFRVLDPSPSACAGQVAELMIAHYDDTTALQQLADWADVVTFDFENVPASAAEQLAQHTAVYPPPAALAVAQDRLSEKTLFRRLDIPTPGFVPVTTRAALEHAISVTGLPAVVKTRRLGYDGKGQYMVQSPADLDPAFAALGTVPLIVEGWVDFQCEVSLLAVRGRDGATVCYPLTENTHRDGILRVSRAPYHDESALSRLAQDYAQRGLTALDYIGVLAIEFFVVNNQLLANEMAPRVHNSGHWTIEGAVTSQFANHLRAICSLPLGGTQAHGHSVMLNAIGDLPDRAACLAVPGAHYHAYGKTARSGRKVGHITLQADHAEPMATRLAELQALMA